MPSALVSTEITDFLTSQPVNWLLANVGDKIRIIHDFRFEETAIGSEENPMTVNKTSGYVGGGWLFDPAGQFGNFQIGDTVVFGDYISLLDFGTFTIINKIGNTAIQFNTPPPFLNDVDLVHPIVSIANPITGVKYRWNFVENQAQPDFFSKIDGSEQIQVRTTADAGDPTVYPMDFLGGLDYRVGNGAIQGGVIFDSWMYFSTFRITYDTFITPIMLAEQLLDAQNGIAPSDFQNSKCFKYVFEIEGLYNYADPNRSIKLSESSVQGNTGWFNENFNTGLTNYSIDSIVYSNFSAIIPKVEFTTNQQFISINIKNNTDSPFVFGQTKFVLNFAKCPIDQSEYQGKNRLMRDNFVFDRAQSIIGAPPVQGELTAIPGMRVLKDVVGIFVSSSEIQINASIFFGSDAFDIINESSNPTYMFWVTVSDHTKTTYASDKVSLLVTPSEYYINNSDPTMIGINNIFLRHFESNPATEGVAIPSVFPNDEIAPYGLFFVDKNGRENDTIILKSVTMRVKAKNSVTLEEIMLDTFTQDISTAPVINGNQYVNSTIPRPFHIPLTEDIRKNIKLIRMLSLDGAGKYWYNCVYPFFVRWEYWNLQTPNDGDFFDTAQPNNGWNMFWHRYSTVANWSLVYEIRILATKNGTLQSYSLECPIESNNFNANPDWINEIIETYDPDSMTLLSGGGNNYLLGYKNNLVRGKMKFNGLLSSPTLADISVAFRVEAFEVGGRDGSRRYSSSWVGADTWFDSQTGNGLIDLSQQGPGFIVVAEALLDGLQLPQNSKFTLYMRLWDKRLPIGGICGINNLRTEDGLCLTMEDGSTLEIE